MAYSLIKPLLFRLDPEFAHECTVQSLRLAQRLPPVRATLTALFHYEDSILATECAGMQFLNPFGMAAGFDKQAELVPGLAALGFGHIEVGTVTPLPQPGNPRPRMFRLPKDHALINRMGFNSQGMDVTARNLRERAPTYAKIGVNIGKNKQTPLEQATNDYVQAFERLTGLGDYVALNISSPNTPGLRQLHERSALATLLETLAARNQLLANPHPIFVKISPDETLRQLDDVVAAVQQAGLAGVIVGNTTLDRTGLHGAARTESGGLSGRPLTTRARELIRYIHQGTDGTLPIIGVGGILNAEDAYGHIRAGATLVQFYTALVYHGPGFVKTLKREVAALLRRDGFSSVQAAVGV